MSKSFTQWTVFMDKTLHLNIQEPNRVKTMLFLII